MSAAATRPDPPDQTGSAAASPSRFAPLISLVRRVIDYGRQLAAALQNPTPAIDRDEVARTFGSYDFRQIIASIIRGLHRAQALETRLARLDARPQPDPQATTAGDSRPPRAGASAPRDRQASTTRPRPDGTAAGPDQAGDNRPIGAVLADICRDLGILPNHPLWRELQLAIIRYDGNLARLVMDIARRPWLSRDTRQPITPGVPLFCRSAASAGTGPPG